MTPTATAIVGFAAWQLALTVMLAVYRTALVQTGKKQVNSFAPDGSDVGGFGRRLTRARDNCYGNLPMFAAIVVGASLVAEACLHLEEMGRAGQAAEAPVVFGELVCRYDSAHEALRQRIS